MTDKEIENSFDYRFKVEELKLKYKHLENKYMQMSCKNTEEYTNLHKKKNKRITFLKQMVKKLNKQLQCKEQESEELKKEIAFGNNGTLSDKIRAEVFKELNNENNQLKAENEKLEQTLIEINDIAEPFCNACQEFEPEKKGSNCMYCNYGKILQKISECEVNND